MGSKNWDRRERYPFWETLLRKLSSVELRLPQPTKSIDRTKRYVRTHLAGTFQMLSKAQGPYALLTLLIEISGGEDRLNARHRAALKEYEQTYRKYTGPSRLDIAALRKACERLGIRVETAAPPKPCFHDDKGNPDWSGWFKWGYRITDKETSREQNAVLT